MSALGQLRPPRGWSALPAAMTAGVAAAGLPPRLQLVAVAVTAGGFAIVAGFLHSRAVVGWVLAACVFFYPYHAAPGLRGVLLPVPTLAAALTVPFLKDRRKPSITYDDGLVAALFGSILLAWALVATGGGMFGTLLASWIPAYVVGRFALPNPRAATRALPLMAAFVGLLAIIESVSGHNWFVLLSADLPHLEGWRAIQHRASMVRAEGALGHAIALGGALSLTLPATLGAGLRGHKSRVMASGLILLGLAATLSRGPLLAGVFVLMLVAWTGARSSATSHRMRRLLVALTLLGLVAAPVAETVWRESRVELDRNTDYRFALMSQTWKDVVPLGVSPQGELTDTGRYVFRGFASIDNAFLDVALNAGAIPAVLLTAILIRMLHRTLRRRANLWELTVAAQLPLLGTVALITQYQWLFWCVVGLAVRERSTNGNGNGGKRA